MSTAKVVELIAEGASVEEAVEAGVADMAKTLHGIQGVWVDNIQARVKDNRVTGYRVNLKITFVVDGTD